jgi:hypothetical protein
VSPFHRVNSPLDAPKKRTNIKKNMTKREETLHVAFSQCCGNVYIFPVPVPTFDKLQLVQAPHLTKTTVYKNF